MLDPVQHIRSYIIDKNESISELDDFTDIIETRLIDSLQFLDLVFFIEEVTDKKINLETIDVGNFRTVDNIRRKFCAEDDVGIADGVSA